MKAQSPCVGTGVVETKRECIEGVTEMLLLNSALERSTPPPFEQRGDVMHAGYDFVGCSPPALMMVARYM